MKRLFISLLLLAPGLLAAQTKATADSLSFYFEFNSHEINFRNARNEATRNQLTALKDKQLILRAYTDSTGSNEYNLKLAESRLESVKKLLLESFAGQFTIRTEIARGEDPVKRPDADKRRVDLLIQKNAPVAENSKKRTFELGVPIRLEIQFVYGQDEILANSFNDIRFLIETMQADKTLFVTLAGHVCCGTDNKNLSGKRADRIKQILVTEGNISSSRITTVGYGNKKPLFVEDSEEHRQANRRVEATFYRK